jgi:endonuclease-3
MSKLTKTQIINKIFEIWSKEYRGRPIIELDYTNPFTMLVAVILSAQATDKGVNKATPKLFKKASTPKEMHKLGEDNLKEYIKSINFFNTKGKNIILMSKMLIDKFNSKLPDTREELTKLPGVGRKTANIILNCVYNKPALAVDTHVFRVANRLGIVHEKNVLDTELALEKALPNKWKHQLNHWMVLHGRYVCKSKKPDCENCKISKFCEFYKKSNKTK